MKQPPEITAAKRRIREAYKRGELIEEQINLLKSVGFDPGPAIKPVVCIELGRLFESATAAGELLGLSRYASVDIRRCCLGKRKTAYNYHWRYATEEEISAGKVLEKDELLKAPRKRGCRGIPIVCIELGRLFESGSDAARELGLSNNANVKISVCCRGKKKTAYGYHWRYATEEEIAAGRVLEKDELFGARPTIPANTKKPVVCIELGRLFEGGSDAARAMGLKSTSGISSCCHGEQGTAYNFHWRFATEAEIVAVKVLSDDRDDA